MRNIQFVCPELPEDDPLEAALPDAGAIEELIDIFSEVMGDDDDDSSSSGANLHPDDPANFYKLSQALRLILSRTIKRSEINEADQLLRAYCGGLLKVSDMYVLPLAITKHIGSFMGLRSFAPTTIMPRTLRSVSVIMARSIAFGRSYLNGSIKSSKVTRLRTMLEANSRLHFSVSSIGPFNYCVW